MERPLKAAGLLTVYLCVLAVHLVAMFLLVLDVGLWFVAARPRQHLGQPKASFFVGSWEALMAIVFRDVITMAAVTVRFGSHCLV